MTVGLLWYPYMIYARAVHKIPAHFFVAVEEVGLQTSWLYLQSSSHSCDCLYTLSPAFLPLKEAPYLVSFQGSSHLSHGVWKHFCFRIRRENLPQSSLNFLSWTLKSVYSYHITAAREN